MKLSELVKECELFIQYCIESDESKSFLVFHNPKHGIFKQISEKIDSEEKLLGLLETNREALIKNFGYAEFVEA